jgi:two-component system, cell cycle response regulator
LQVLVAHSDKHVRERLQRELLELGHKVLLAEDGRVAWRMVRGDGGPLVLLLEDALPLLTATNVARRLRRVNPAPYRYCILLGRAPKEGLPDAIDEFLQAPFYKDQLVARLRGAARLVELQARMLAVRDALAFQATRDGLTSLPNRRCIMAELERSMARGITGVLLLDLDHFKKVNDTFGHQVGDRVLVESAAAWRTAMRNHDMLGRYGGEEFLAVLPGALAGDVQKVAERLRAAVDDLDIQAEGRRVPVSCSIGAAHAHPGTLTTDQLLKAADDALYTAKRQGRNRVELHELTGPLLDMSQLIQDDTTAER